MLRSATPPNNLSKGSAIMWSISILIALGFLVTLPMYVSFRDASLRNLDIDLLKDGIPLDEVDYQTNNLPVIYEHDVKG